MLINMLFCPQLKNRSYFQAEGAKLYEKGTPGGIQKVRLWWRGEGVLKKQAKTNERSRVQT